MQICIFIYNGYKRIQTGSLQYQKNCKQLNFGGTEVQKFGELNQIANK